MITHALLVDKAVQWLKRERGKGGPMCHIALAGPKNGFNHNEIPDAIGWRAGIGQIEGYSILIECKTSWDDFQSDKAKPFRQHPALGMGQFRYYMIPGELLERVQQALTNEDDPRKGWGILYVNQHNQIKKHSESQPFKYNKALELDILVRALLRVGDPDKVNKRMRAADAAVSYMQRQIDSLNKTNKKLNDDLLKCLYGQSRQAP
jgi:hypothetical protein